MFLFPTELKANLEIAAHTNHDYQRGSTPRDKEEGIYIYFFAKIPEIFGDIEI